MTEIVKAAKKLIDCVEFDMNGAGGKGGNGGLLSDTTLRAAHDLRVIMSSEAVSAWKTMGTAPRNGTVIQAWHTVHKCPISILWNEKGHDFNGETLHWFERSYTTVWPEHVFSHWMPLPGQPTTKGGAA